MSHSSLSSAASLENSGAGVAAANALLEPIVEQCVHFCFCSVLARSNVRSHSEKRKAITHFCSIFLLLGGPEQLLK